MKINSGMLIGALFAMTLPVLHAQANKTPEERFFAAMDVASRETTKIAGGLGGGEFKEIFPNGGILVGFDVWHGPYVGAANVIYGIRPIYETLTGRQRGEAHGSQKGALITIEADKGNAVAGLHIRTGSVIDGFQLMYQKIDYFGYKLTGSNSYKSEKVGGEGGAKRVFPLTTNGKPIVGICGRNGYAVDALGLIYADKNK